MTYPGPEPMTTEQYEVFRRRTLALSKEHSRKAHERLENSGQLDVADKAKIDALLAIYELLLLIPGVIVLDEEAEV
jgi:hypothetical protein